MLIGDEMDSVVAAMAAMKHTGLENTFWFPFVNSGTDRFSMSFAPWLMGVIFAVLPTWAAYQFLHISMIALGVIGVYLLSQKIFQMSRIAGYFAALGYGHILSFSNLYKIESQFVPIIILILIYLFENLEDWKYWILLVFVAVVYATTAYLPVMIVFPTVFIFSWFLIFERDFNWQHWLIIALLYTFVYLIRAQDFWALFLNAPDSTRAFSYTTTLGPDYWSLPTAIGRGVQSVLNTLKVAPSFAGGIVWIPLEGVFAWLFILSLLFLRGNDLKAWRLAQLVGFCAFMVVFIIMSKSFLYDVLPLIRGFQVGRLWQHSVFLFALSGGLCIHALEKKWASEKNKISRQLIVGLFGVVFVYTLANKITFSTKEWISQGNYVQNFESPVIRDLADKIRQDGEISRVGMFQMYAGYLGVYGLEAPGGKVGLYSHRYHEFWKTMNEPGVGIDENADRTRNKGYFLQLGAATGRLNKKPEHHLSETTRLNLLSLSNTRYIISKNHLVGPGLRLLNKKPSKQAWNELDARGKIMTSFKANFTGGRHLFVYENTQALPRFFFAERILLVKTPTEVRDAIKSLSADALRRTMFAEKDSAASDIDSRRIYSTNGSIKVTHYSTDSIDLRVALDGDALLAVSNTFSPFWVARANNKRVPIFPSYGTFMGVFIPDGTTDVTFRYEPPYSFR